MRKRDAYIDHLSKVPMFSACSKRELQALARQADAVQVPEGKELIREGSVGKEFFVIVGGKARVTRKGRELAKVGPGDFFGELALLDRSPRNATVTALTDLEVVVLAQREFNQALRDVPSMTKKLLVGMARRIHELDAEV